jgi:UDP-glucuronate 4-epimerase
MQKGDVEATFADVDPLTQLTGFKPQTSLKQGVEHFIAWYKAYYKL